MVKDSCRWRDSLVLNISREKGLFYSSSTIRTVIVLIWPLRCYRMPRSLKHLGHRSMSEPWRREDSCCITETPTLAPRRFYKFIARNKRLYTWVAIRSVMMTCCDYCVLSALPLAVTPPSHVSLAFIRPKVVVVRNTACYNEYF